MRSDIEPIPDPSPEETARYHDACDTLTAFGAEMFVLMMAAAGKDLSAVDVERVAREVGAMKSVTEEAPCCATCECVKLGGVFPLTCNRAPDHVYDLAVLLTEDDTL